MIQSGDLIFIGNSSSLLSSAIDKVTKTSLQTSYSHMGIISIEGNTTYVYHSNSYNGVCKELLDTFRLKNGTSNDSSYIYRIKDLTPLQINNALIVAKTHLGKPYNRTYILEDEGFYCSEYIYTLFEKDSIFELIPMTFKNPGTDEFNEIWTKHYQELGIEIPEGLPGCNPNGMAENKRLELIAKL